ncbi:exporter of polyketide antibiotics [Virgisporangium aliadipatigenens]|uniref:Exporter of polyketide antibiotics n=2 Tax=Virgisporangium aliadipatigenens TaxID=741659 RepID=A0A8J4DNZ5_9ACTN|nr:exporter of polyketide antibiotics [Virgisporangium aliadipatigenens]
MSAFTGTWRLVRLALRRDRIQLPVWILGITVMLSSSLASLAKTYPTEAERATVLKTAANTPTILVLRGPPTGTGEGQLYAFQLIAFLCVLAAFMSTLAVVRHTRQNEETGRAEMIGATVVGRFAPLTAALTVVILSNALLGVLITGVLAGDGQDAQGAAVFATGLALNGIAFAGIAAFAAQLTDSARSANGIAAAAIGVAYALRGAGDALGDVHADGIRITSAWPSWTNPIGWAQQAFPFDANRWWVLLLPLALFAIGTGTAFAISEHRDWGTGLLPSRPGPAKAPRALLSPVGLAWRLQRGILLGWAIGIVALAAGVGTLTDALREAMEDNANANDLIRRLGNSTTADLITAFYSSMATVTGLIVAGYVVQATLRLRTEEAAGHLEPVLATATARYRWLAAHLACAVLGSGAILLASGAAMALGASKASGDLGESMGELVPALLVQWPATLVFAGIVVAVFGVLPRYTIALGSTAFVLSLVFGLFGGLLDLPQAVRDLSPFSHVPALPAVDVSWTPVVLMTAAAVVSAAGGAVAFRRRDLST